MKLFQHRLRRLRSEEGAVTVDWVVLTALLVPLGMVVGTLIWGPTENAAEHVASFIGAQTTLVPGN